jgi:hypothetical protein
VITSLNSAGESDTSRILELRTKDLVAPIAVLNPHVASGDAKLTVTWDFQYDAVYDVLRSNSENGIYDTIATNVDAVRYEDKTAANGTTYYYKVVAHNGAGRSPETAVLWGKPAAGRHVYISFNESTGAFAQDTWGGYHGTLAATAARDTGYTAGAVKLDGTATSYVKLGEGLLTSLNDFTVAAWVKMDALSNWMRVFDFGTGTSTYMFLTVQANVSGGLSTIRYGIKNTTAEQSISYGYAFPLNTWTHLAITQSGSTVSLYINGELATSNSAITLKPADIGNTNQNYIGKSQWNDPLLKGSIDEFKMYNRALSAFEITEAMKEEQLITFNAFEEKKISDSDFNAAATTSSGLPVAYTSSNENVAVIAEGMIHITGAGTTNITAVQPGDARFAGAAPVVQKLTVTKLYYVDGDNDGFGSGESKWIAEAITPAGYSENNTDCNDSSLLYTDSDGDGLGAGSPVACGVANNTDCDDTNPVPVTAAIPDAYIMNSSGIAKNTIYIGYGPASLTIGAQPAGGTAPYSYLWSTGQTTSSITVGSAASYVVRVTDAKGCTANASIAVKTQNVTCGNRNDKVLVCHNGRSICIAVPAVYAHLCHGDKLGSCESTSPGTPGDGGNTDAVIYPNPAKDHLTVRVGLLNNGATVQIYNSLGRLVIARNLANTVTTISLRGLCDGMYYVRVKNGQQITIQKIIKE